MGTHFFNRHTIWTVFVLFFIALGLGACSDVSNAPAPTTVTVPPPPPESSLSHLTVSPGGLPFLSSVTGYSVNVASSITSVTVSAQTLDQNARASINSGPSSSSPNRPISLGAPGTSTRVLIVVTAQSGSQSTYSVTVNRSGGSNDLQNLTISPGLLSPAFSASSTNYTVVVASAIGSVSVTATLQDPLATMRVNNQETSSGQPRSVDLGPAGSPTPITIIVTAPNGSPKTYLININRTAFASDNNLSALTILGQTLNPGFAPNTQIYTVSVASEVTSVMVTATKSDPNATMSGLVSAGVGQATGQSPITLNGQGTSTTILITVIAPNTSSKIYTITVNRAAPASDNNLSALSVTGQTLAPAFAASTLNYTVNVATNVTSVTVAATKPDPNATLSGSLTAGAGTADRPTEIPLTGPGTSKVLSITVTAPDTSAKTYTITVDRAAPASDNNLSALSVTGQTLAPAFAASTLNYTVNVAAGVTSVTVAAIKSDPNATMAEALTAGAGTANTSVVIPLTGPGTSTVVPITVTAPDTSAKTYTITVNRAASAGGNNL
ncbi:MAG: Cadherin-like beta sandwich domain-containing protein [Nitrospira sp.]|nr:MAG: Cadherin-like beta sandwich domain-containing protein [Nitrospira sp.]